MFRWGSSRRGADGLTSALISLVSRGLRPATMAFDEGALEGLTSRSTSSEDLVRNPSAPVQCSYHHWRMALECVATSALVACRARAAALLSRPAWA